MSEKTDKQTKAALSEIKRCMSRLSFIGMGLSKDLDQALIELRDLIKASESEKKIKKQVDRIGKILVSLEDGVQEKSSQMNEIADEVNVLQLLIAQNLPQQLKSELKKLTADENKKAEAIVGSIAQAINRFVAEMEASDENKAQPTQAVPATPEEQPKQGFFARLFGGKKTEVAKEHPGTKADKSSAPVLQLLKSSLQQLVGQLSHMEAYRQGAAQLALELEELHDIAELSEFLGSVTRIFVEVSGQEHEQFEIFLKSLSQRIDKVNQFISETVNYSGQVKEQSGKLDNDLIDSVSSIKSSVESSTSLDEVKQNIYKKMDDIVERVNDFYQQQSLDHDKLTSNLENLKEQLVETEVESSRLREDLASQKVRAQTDPLTSLPNRYAYNERLAQEYNRWMRYQGSLALVVGDIDHFKKINDEYGHACGDEVLKDLSRFIKSELRVSDFIARYGGEEFIMLLPETSLIDATKAMNKIRLGLKNVQHKHGEDRVTAAMSFGIAEFETGDTPKIVFERADKALYRAKEKGRDQVCCQRRS